MEKSKSFVGNKNHTNTDVNIEIKEHRFIAHHGENVKYYRTAKSLTQEYMAAELNVSQPKFSELEKRNVIEEKILAEIAKTLNLGIEWLKDIPISKNFYSYHQDGNGNTNFQNTGDVNYNINNPIDKVDVAYKEMINILKETNEDLKAAIEKEKKERMEILERFAQYMENQKS